MFHYINQLLKDTAFMFKPFSSMKESCRENGLNQTSEFQTWEQESSIFKFI